MIMMKNRRYRSFYQVKKQLILILDHLNNLLISLNLNGLKKVPQLKTNPKMININRNNNKKSENC